MAKRNIWRGSYYIRNKQTDKWGNKYHTQVSLRQRGSGIVVTPKGKFVTIEPPHKHNYGYDHPIRKVKKPSTFVRPNLPTALKRRSGHVRRLR